MTFSPQQLFIKEIPSGIETAVGESSLLLLDFLVDFF
jgi:hypothetical protein